MCQCPRPMHMLQLCALRSSSVLYSVGQPTASLWAIDRMKRGRRYALSEVNGQQVLVREVVSRTGESPCSAARVPDAYPCMHRMLHPRGGLSAEGGPPGEPSCLVAQGSGASR